MRATSVLIVDDDPGICQMLSEALALRGYAAETAMRGAEVLRRLAQHPVDAAIIDLVLPDLPGLDLLQAIKSGSPDTEVIVITGHASLPTALQAIDGTAFAYLIKPFSLDHLLATVAKALEKQGLARALRDSESRYRLIAEQIRDAVFLLDLEGRVVFANGRAGHLLGIPLSEFEGQQLTGLLGEESGPLEGTGSAEIEICRPDGTRRWVEVTRAPVLEGGCEVACVAVVRDLTHKKRAEGEIRRQREALFRSEKLAAMGQLLAGVAHELNNPLSVVMGQTVLIRETAGEPRVVARADKIAQAAERCARIVRDFLVLARRYPRDRQRVALNQVVREALEVAAETLAAHAVEVTLALVSDLPAIWADRSQVEQVVANLVSNAHQALRESPGPRRLSITTGHDLPAERVVLEVIDSGPGVAPPARRHLFEPFFTTRAHGQGMGLGLALCQGIVEGHGGRIVHDEPAGGGARFRVELPMHRPEGGEEGAGAAPGGDDTSIQPPVRGTSSRGAPTPFRGRRILVVEDEAAVAQVLAELLEMDGHTVDIAPDGEMALERLGDIRYDVVVSDLRMPGLDGPGLYREVERRWPERCGQFVFLTGDTTGEDTAAFLEATGVLSLAKPLVLDEVRHAIRRSVARQVLADGPD